MKNSWGGWGELAAVMFFLAGCGPKDTGVYEETAVVGPAELRDVISQTGEVRPVLKVDLKCEASGTIEKIFVKEGQSLNKGDKILVIDPSRLRTSKQKLDLLVEQARIERDQAQRALARAKELAVTGAVSQKQLEDLQSAFDLRDIAYRQRLLERADIADQLARTTVVAPISGVLTSLDVEEGEIVQSATSGMQAGTTIGTIADITNLEVITQIGEADYTKLRTGQSVVITPEAVEGAHTRGTITFISLAAKKKGGDELGTFEVRISVDSIIPGIVPGVNVHVEFVVLEKKVAMAVPYHYVQKKNGSYTVLVRSSSERQRSASGEVGRGGQSEAQGSDSTATFEGRKGRRPGERRTRGQGSKGRERTGGRSARPVEIQVGDTDYRYYEVLGGLSVGDTVVYVAPKAASTSSRPSGGPPAGGRR